jgi:hypothetical protein
MKKNIHSFFKALFIITSLLTINACAKDKKEDINCSDYNFKNLDFEYSQPNCINFLFQVSDEDGGGVIGLTEDDFKVLEDGNKIGSEANLTIVPNDQIPYSIKTVLLLDVSTSVQSEIENIKTAAITMANNKASNQEIAVYTFSSNLDQVLGFSSSKSDIVNAINSITVGSSSTNLYGALTGVSNLYTELYSVSQIEAGNIVLFTDGDDTQGSTTLSAAQSALLNKSIFIVALDGPDYDEATRNVMNSFEPINLLESSNSSELSNLFDEIIQNITNTSKSTYWLYFSSPKRGANQHSLSLEFTCEDNYNLITNSFNSSGFTDGTCSSNGGTNNPTNFILEKDFDDNSIGSAGWTTNTDNPLVVWEAISGRAVISNTPPPFAFEAASSRLVSPVIDLSGTVYPKLSFIPEFAFGSSVMTLYIEDLNNSFEQAVSQNWSNNVANEIPLDPYADLLSSSAQIRLIFEFNASSNTASNFVIDDIQIFE